MSVSCFSSVSIVTRIRTGGPGHLYLDITQKNLLFSSAIFIAAVVPTYSSVQRISVLICRQLKRWEREANYSPVSSAVDKDVRNCAITNSHNVTVY